MGEDVDDSIIMIPLQRFFPDSRFDWVAHERVKVVDASQPREVVASALLGPSRQDIEEKLIRYEGRTGWDRLAFRVRCPARSVNTYFIYVAAREPDGKTVSWPSDLPSGWPQGSYGDALDLQIDRPVDRVTVASYVVNDHLEVRAQH